MCYEFGTLEQETNGCMLCKLLANDNPCPHKDQRRVCQERQNHTQPIVFFTNAEYAIFNGCGYCKWAKRFPNVDRNLNKGWPGCCRAPKLGEMELIEEADWPIVAKRYKLPDRSRLGDRPSRSATLSKTASRSGASARRGSMDLPKEEKEARARNSSSPVRRGSPRIVDQPPVKGSPRREAEEVNGNGPYRASVARPGANGNMQSISTSYIVAEERQPGMYHTRPIPRNGQMTVAGPIPPPTSDPLPAARTSSLRRPANGSTASSSTGYPKSSESADSIQSFSDFSKEFSKDFKGLSLSSTSSNRDSMTTVVSDGAFTDYLSDESEAELQRQAEIQAAQLRRLRLEDAEFRAAQRGLANIDLQTPVAWNPVPARPYNPSAYARR